MLKSLDYLPGIGCSQGARVPRLCHLQSHELYAQPGAPQHAGLDRGLLSDHKKADGECVATHTMEIQSYLVKKKPN